MKRGIISEFDLVGKLQEEMGPSAPKRTVKSGKTPNTTCTQAKTTTMPIVNKPTVNKPTTSNGTQIASVSTAVNNTNNDNVTENSNKNNNNNELFTLASTITSSLALLMERQEKMAAENREWIQKIVTTNQEREAFNRQEFMKANGINMPTAAPTATTSSQNDCQNESDNILDQIDQICGDQEESENESPEPEDDILEELSEEYTQQDETGPPTGERLSKLLNTILGTALTEEKVKSLVEQYNRPANLEMVQVPKVNLEIWQKLRGNTRSRDIKQQRVQQRLVKSQIPLIQVIEELLKAKKDPKTLDLSTALRKLFDAFSLMCGASQELSQRRREGIRPDLNANYGQLCSQNIQPATSLFGDDLPQSIKDISETNRVGFQLKRQNTGFSKNGGTNKFKYNTNTNKYSKYNKFKSDKYKKTNNYNKNYNSKKGSKK